MKEKIITLLTIGASLKGFGLNFIRVGILYGSADLNSLIMKLMALFRSWQTVLS
jgi:hypothetical protein